MAVFNAVRLIIFASFAALVLAIDIRVLEKTDIQFTRDDIVPVNNMVKKFEDEKRQHFIGDLTVGNHRSQETVFRRRVDISNPTDEVYHTAIKLRVDSGIIHYISVSNEPGSYAVACDDLYTLGSSESSINLRVMPGSKSILTMVIAAH